MPKGVNMRRAKPASASRQGPVKQAASVAALAGGADLPTTVTKVNAILTALKNAGIMVAP